MPVVRPAKMSGTRSEILYLGTHLKAGILLWAIFQMPKLRCNSCDKAKTTPCRAAFTRGLFCLVQYKSRQRDLLTSDELVLTVIFNLKIHEITTSLLKMDSFR